MNAVTPAPRLTRRTLLAGSALAALSACAQAPQVPTGPAPVGSTAPTAPPSGPPAATTGTAAPTASAVSSTPPGTPPPATPGAAVLSRAQIVERYRAVAPTVWSSGEFTPVEGLVRRTKSDKVVLTLDACGGPHGSLVDTELIDFVRAERNPAVLFLNKRWIEANRALFDTLASQRDLFDIGNHGTRHCPLSVTGRSQYKEQGTRDPGEVYDEVMGNHEFLAGLLGEAPRFFRTGTAWYDDVALKIVSDCGELPIGFDINGDAGTTFTAPQMVASIGKAKAGSIIIGHMNQPKGKTYEGFRIALPKVRARGLQFAKLSDVAIS